MDSQLSVNCSPGTFQRIQSDENYRREIIGEVLKGQDSTVSELVFTPVEHSALSQESVAAEEDFTPIQPSEEGPKMIWLEAPTKLMLSLLQELQPKVGKSVQVKDKTKMWKIIEERMAFEGYNFSSVQIENKFRGLERQFKKTMLHNRRTGSNRETCPYQSELNDILGKRHSVNASYSLHSADVTEPYLSESASDLDQPMQDEEIDVVSVSDKKLPTNPSDRDRRAIEHKVGYRFSTARIVKNPNGIRTIPPRRRGSYTLPYTPASSSPVKSVSTSRYPSPSSTPYHSGNTTTYANKFILQQQANALSTDANNGHCHIITSSADKSRKRLTMNSSANSSADVSRDLDYTLPPSKKHRGKKSC
ncbi:PREDICTED: myc protein-like [Rhagoletis zephyria]|uniref:myc protein-like n=1 Tax=Rhagoletis zephyria TaxID=28612 RepID=UPI00081132EB|nr:PREDICTED: myc protein-like [Rhagoletis zephyria]